MIIESACYVACVMLWAVAIVPGAFALGELIENALKKRRRLRDFPGARVL